MVWALARKKRDILFVCGENAGSSQMAQAFGEKMGLRCTSAGTAPASELNPLVVAAMLEKGIDISRNSPMMLTAGMLERASLIVTMGCSISDVCPEQMLAKIQGKLVNWVVKDPKGKSLEEVMTIRDEIETRVRNL